MHAYFLIFFNWNKIINDEYDVYGTCNNRVLLSAVLHIFLVWFKTLRNLEVQ